MSCIGCGLWSAYLESKSCIDLIFSNFKESERLFTAIRWFNDIHFCHYNNASKPTRHEALFLAAAFEALLDLPNTNISKTFRSRVSKLLEAQNKYENIIRDFYNLRSNFIHGNKDINKTTLSTQKIFNKMRTLFILCFIKLISNRGVKVNDSFTTKLQKKFDKLQSKYFISR